jgi:hypothetical protein
LSDALEIPGTDDASRAHEQRARWANDRMWASLATRPGPIPFFCECGSGECYAPVWLTADAYARRRRDEAWRLIAADPRPHLVRRGPAAR